MMTSARIMQLRMITMVIVKRTVTAVTVEQEQPYHVCTVCCCGSGVGSAVKWIRRYRFREKSVWQLQYNLKFCSILLFCV